MLGKNLKYYCSGRAFNIDGLGKNVIDQPWDLQFIRNLSDIFNLDTTK